MAPSRSELEVPAKCHSVAIRVWLKWAEATWGADPLESYGGFHNLSYNVDDRFPSSLTKHGEVQWSLFEASSLKREPWACKASLRVHFPEVDWAFLQQVYGWSITQYQAWARGFLVSLGQRSHMVELFTDNILEFLVDGRSYFGGDAYGFRRAPLVLCLGPGEHRLEVRLVRDVRSMGGLDQPSLDIIIEARICRQTLSILVDQLIIPEVVEGKLPSLEISVPVRNTSQDWIAISAVDISLLCMDDHRSKAVRISRLSENIAPGQTRPLPIQLETLADHKPVKMVCRIRYACLSHVQESSSVEFAHTFIHRTIEEPHKITFLHPSRCVSYAILRAPCLSDLRSPLPVMLALHGAGVEADSTQMRHALDLAPDLPAWALFPSGMSPWSGDDWHTWGFLDVIAAIRAVTQWIANMKWDGPGVDIRRWFICGHSNGGQGTYHALTHCPGMIMGAAPISGYMSIQSYVPYHLWTEAEPRAVSAIQASLAKHRHELLCANFAGIPVFQQHGDADDNVPAFHSRRMRQLIAQSPSSSTYSELAGKGHWFQGVMTTPNLLRFYRAVLEDQIPRILPNDFQIVIPNPTGMIPIGGLFIDQLESPDRLGKLGVKRDIQEKAWCISTSNVLRFHFSTDSYPSRTSIVIDGCLFPSSDVEEQQTTIVKEHDGAWKLEKGQEWKIVSQRYGRQLEHMDAILHTAETFSIVFVDQEEERIALQISRNLYQYFSADSRLLVENMAPMKDSGNFIVVALHRNPSPATLPSFPIQVHAHRIVLHLAHSQRSRRVYELEQGDGAIFLRPLPDEGLELFIWGFDLAGLQRAARLMPMLTGVGQPDFVILGKESAWKGVGGVLAMGFLDSLWRISEGSYIT